MPLLSPVGDYQTLHFGVWLVSPTFTTGVRPPTKPNAISYTAYSNALKGTPFITPIDASSAFDLYSFYYGCQVATVEGAVGLPISCTFTVTGYKGNRKVGKQTFEYEPSNDLLAPMKYGVLGSWATSLTNVTFATFNDTIIATKLDNVKYAIIR